MSLGVFFKESSLRTVTLENVQKALGLPVAKLTIPAATRWTSHANCYPKLLANFEAILIALNSIRISKDDEKAMGLIRQMLDPDTVLSWMTIHDMFELLRPLILWLQKASADVNISMLQRLVKETS